MKRITEILDGKSPSLVQLAITFAVLLSACVGSEGSEPTDDPSVVSIFPYTEENGVLVCGLRPAAGVPGAGPAHGTEWYPLETMNRHLQNVGTKDAVPHVTEAFRAALHERGITRIESCEDAREYVRLNHELIEWRIPDMEPEPATESIPFVPDDDAVVSKILNGTSFDNPQSVAVWVDPTDSGELCTGQLINQFALLTAAHCLPSWVTSQPFVEIHAWIATNWSNVQCIAGPANCADAGSGSGTATVFAAPHPSYDGTSAFDQAVVIANPGWRAPANTSARWTAFPYNMEAVSFANFTQTQLRIAGYGVNATTGGGAGLSRRGNATKTMSGTGTNVFRISRLSATSPIGCKGDSGGGAHTGVNVGGTIVPISFGLFSKFTFMEGLCGASGAPTVYSVPDGQWVMNLINFFGGGCNKVTTPNYSFVRCF